MDEQTTTDTPTDAATDTPIDTPTDAATADAATADAATADAATMGEALGADGELIDEIEQSLGGESVSRIELEGLEAESSGAQTMRDMDLLGDVDVEVSVEFGRAHLPLRQLLMLEPGSLVELDRQPEQQVTVLANGTPIALGDIVMVGDRLGVHIVELIDPNEPPDLYSPKVTFEAEGDSEDSHDSDEADDSQDSA